MSSKRRKVPKFIYILLQLSRNVLMMGFETHQEMAFWPIVTSFGTFLNIIPPRQCFSFDGISTFL